MSTSAIGSRTHNYAADVERFERQHDEPEANRATEKGAAKDLPPPWEQETVGRETGPQSPATMEPSFGQKILNLFRKEQAPATGQVEHKRTATTDAAGLNCRVYTDNEKEAPVRNTRPVPREMVAELQRQWPGLTELGAQTLVAQSAAETGDWKNCYNWNFGNVKAHSTSEPHMYLAHVWEGMTPEQFAQAKKGPLGHLVHEDTARGHNVGAGKVSVMFEPPHPQCLFRSYPTKEEAFAAFATKMQQQAQRNPAFLEALNKGDTATVAHILKQNGYYSANEGAYAKLLASKLEQVRNAQ